MTDNKAPPMIIFPVLSYIFVHVERCVQLFSTFSDQQIPTFPPTAPERNCRRKPVTAGALFESDSLSVHVFRAMQLSDSWRHVAIRQKYKWDRQGFCGGWTCLSVCKFVRAECVRGSLLSFFGTVVNVLKHGLIFTKDRTIKMEFGTRSDVTFKMATFYLAAGKARWVCQLLLAFLAKKCTLHDIFVWEQKNCKSTGRCCTTVSMQLFKDTKIRPSGQKMSLNVDKVGGHIEFRIRIVCHSRSWT